MISGAAIKGAAIGSAAALALLPAVHAALDRRQQALAAEARLAAALGSVPAAPVATPDLARRVRAEAGRSGVLVERAEVVAGRLQLRLSGSQQAVLALADGLERRGVRSVRWSMTGDGRAVRLDAAAVASARPVSGPTLSRVHARALFAGEADETGGEPPSDAPELVGVVGRIGQDAVAMVRAGDGATRTLAIGEGVDGWTLESLAIDAAFFTRGGQRARVPLPAGE
ncbi:hypothetical protein SAMN06297144_1673 [Sphingomonas guangdongensis]|uniref:Type II secretion system (T2SS), protein M subtype b n=1 Tax=Sphingomonas guangdongensis TaxID=1141890 RepID=A0A285R2H4_9SPHN|nr:hypothetical protein [Sphingomonas guangdongensis]SOB86567.1 hypothetical protein SAMN06297144_1673 [Sphingomonas guangdongensis]